MKKESQDNRIICNRYPDNSLYYKIHRNSRDIGSFKNVKLSFFLLGLLIQLFLLDFGDIDGK